MTPVGAIFGTVPVWTRECNMSGFDQAKVGLHGSDPLVICHCYGTDACALQNCHFLCL